ncbi:Ultraviolet-B receptor UVR8 [Ananas comosus]|uniref:Ultraviolet-B receptor UVR8 n=1 Tax=Ananas comosus TaxID=4615 RepID=A0A199UN54_ANACO|nr:Ultraviolet-B receptor UVR8 [Ananas comosus]
MAGRFEGRTPSSRGIEQVNFLRQRQPEKESQSFSLIYQNGERSLDLICKDKEQAESWFLGLTALVSASHHPKPSTELRNNRWASSCVNSPASYIKTKHKLGILQDPVKFSQARYLYGSPPRSLKDRFLSDNALDTSEVFTSPRQRTLSDMQAYLDRILPRVPHAVVNNFKEIANPNKAKEKRTISTPKTSSYDHGSPQMINKNDSLKDVFIWGNGLTVDSSVPKLLDCTQMLDVQNIACGENIAALVTKQGEVFCWGEENSGRLGHKTNIDVSYPKVVESLSNISVRTIAFGAQFTCAVTSSGEFYEWGNSSNCFGLSCDGNKRIQWFPHRVCGPLDGINISKVACGEWHTAIISSSGRLFTYGEGAFGVLGHGDFKSFPRPKEVESLKGLRVKSVACGPWHTAAVVEIIAGAYKNTTPNSKLFTWGDSDRGRLGHTDKERKLVPTCVESLVDCDFVQVSCGTALTVALTINGLVFTMGSSVHGQLGNPHSEEGSISTVEGLLKTEFVKEISSGSFHVAVLTTKGKVFTWGKGLDGQLGLGDCIDRNSPALVEALEDRHGESIACGSNFTAAICLHKSISSKDQLVCNGCKMIFGFTRKKHNCYNCGSVFCHSCSSNKATNAALAPDRNKKYRVCDPCFNQLRLSLDRSITNEFSGPKPLSVSCKGNFDMKMNIEETFRGETKACTPRVSRVLKEANLNDGKILSTLGDNLQSRDPVLPIGRAEKSGQEAGPMQFGDRPITKSSFLPPSKQQIAPVQAVQNSVRSKTLPRDAAGLKQDLHFIDKILSEEVKRLHAEAAILAEQCQHKSQKLQQYKHKIEETWVVARDEAAKCKAAKDIIKVLTNQMNALAERLSSGKQVYDMNSLQNDVSTERSQLADISGSRHPKSDSGKLNQFTDARVVKGGQINNDSVASSNSATSLTGPVKHQDIKRLSSDGHNSRTNGTHGAVKASDETVVQIERGVYATFMSLPGGQKGLRRVRFSRKHFSEKGAEKWWEENRSRVFAKYNIEQMAASCTSNEET